MSRKAALKDSFDDCEDWGELECAMWTTVECQGLLKGEGVRVSQGGYQDHRQNLKYTCREG